ncbi:porin [Polynucleobacter sp. MWH-Loch1C5]|uniref:porin n=1 Tax=Polynucleobacter sp. MWH-Loch1C5 TaxID=2689108 RepID=UPI001C0A9421|nr:porin [Polynucleobacter sp. MWH-Loch1C5]MBU3542349.1 porin [Polynucleobacter sp. MWH-Loch1C5]
MKKSLIALAALSAFATAAQAQSSVTVYGVLDMSYTEVENKATTSSGTTTAKIKDTGNGDGALSTSRLGFRGVEDLGGGLKANFQLEYDLVNVGTGGTGLTVDATSSSTAVNSGFGARYSWIGLEDAKLGALRLGRQEQSIHSVVVAGTAGNANNITGQIYSSDLSGVSTNSAKMRPHAVFVDRAVTYISPSFNGVRAELQTANTTTKPGVTGVDEVSTNEVGGSLKYSAGKFAAAYGFATTESDTSTSTNSTADTKVRAISASYDFGPVQAFALNTERKELSTAGALTGTGKTKATEIGVRVPMGKTMLWASAFDGDRDTGSATSDVAGYQVGATYAMSKRTTVYGIYGNQEIKGTGSNSANKTESTGMAVGVRHSF